MRRLVVALAFFSLAACSVTTVDKGPSSGDPSSNPASGSGSDGGVAPGKDDGSTTGTNGNDPPASSLEASIDVDGTCPAFSGCGGNPQGTFDYTGGCIDDVFADARKACPSLDASKVDVSVKGSLYFAGNHVRRSVTLRVSGDLVLPAACTYGQCAMIEKQLQGSFDSVSCSGSADCTCTISKTDTDSDGTTYVIAGSTLTTAEGEKYEICENGAGLTYAGRSAGTERGTFELKKR